MNLLLPIGEDGQSCPRWLTIPEYRRGLEEHGVPMTLVCQLNLSELGHALLPYKGMLYIFAYLDYFFEDFDADYPGMGEWPNDFFRVVYTPVAEGLHVHKVVDENGDPACPSRKR